MIEESQSVDFEELIVDDPKSLSFAYHSLDQVPMNIVKHSSSSYILKVDLTETGIKNLDNLQHFKNLQTIVLDKNNLTDVKTMPYLPNLNTLWINNNNIIDLPEFMDTIVTNCPNLKYLSIMRNPCTGGLMDIKEPDLEAIRMYRLYIIYRLPKLSILDFSDITESERTEAKLRGQYAAKRSNNNDMKNNNNSKSKIGNIIVGVPKSTTPPQPKGKVSIDKNKKFDSKHSEGNRFIVNSQL
jgi:predicted secreted protein